MGLQESTNRYRVTSQRLLPRFESRKNPFRGTAGADQEEVAKEPGVAATGATTVESIPQAAAASAPQAAAAPANLPQESASKSALWNWCAVQLKQLRFGRGERRVKPAVPRFTKPMVQAELSLEGVKVVRNDLRDSDLEIVTAKTSTVANHAPGAPVISNQSEPVSGWSRVASRFVGAIKQ